MSMSNKYPDFASRYSRHGYQIDVRQTYAHLPCQPFWTWLTGKSLWSKEPRKPNETWLKEWQLWAQIVWGYTIIILSVLAASIAYHSNLSAWQIWPTYIVSCVLVVNRTRGLLHSFHYTNHGATLANMDRAKTIATLFLSVPIMHTAWKNYHKLHAQVHHGATYLCTDDDPDQQFMTQHGFRLGMSEREFWLRMVFAPFFPNNVWGHIWFRIEQNFILPGRKEIAIRSIYWIMFIALVTYLEVWTEIALFLFVPMFIVTQFSSWIQHTTEHLWFPVVPSETSQHVMVGAMTWGRFLGRPHPGRGRGFRHGWRLLSWWVLAVVIDLPLRLFSFMQDLPSHDFHHRAPRVNFWSIAQERAANEGRPSKFGPMTETWGLTESWLILRDHLCRNDHDPFGLFIWERNRRLQVA